VPIDLFGPAHAGVSVSVLAFSYGLAQVVISPLVGVAIDRIGFGPLSLLLAVLPILGVLVLAPSLRRNENADPAFAREPLLSDIRG
jgi:hypothetical protein